jgi:hypothetical protein
VSGVLLVEGKDDEHVFYALLEFYGIPEVFKIKDKEGIDNLLGTLDVELLASELGQLGIVIDADTDLAKGWQRTKNILQNSGYTNLPALPDPEGTVIVEEGHPKVGVWIMPDNRLPGMLEHFVSFLVPEGDVLWERANDCIRGIPDGDRRFAEAHLIKAQIHTWLAWQVDPGTPLGLAITKRYLEPGSAHAQQLMNWIRTLFL